MDVLADYGVVTNFSLPKIKMLSTMLKVLVTGNVRSDRVFHCFHRLYKREVCLWEFEKVMF